MTVSERFLAKVEKHDADCECCDGCWLWTGATNAKGYGRFGLNGRNRLAYSVAWEIFVGPIPNDGLVFDHLCDTKPCVNPSHLARVTNAQNVARGYEVRSKPSTCRNGHAKSSPGPCGECQTATRQRYEQRRRDAGLVGIAPKDRTHCPKGHPYDERNTGRNGSSARSCKTCRAEQQRIRRADRRAELSTR